MNTALDSALGLVARGLAVCPLHYPVRRGDKLICSCGNTGCENAAKHPFAKLVPNGIKNATTDPAQIRGWWRGYPQLNIAVAATGLLILDVDPRHGGYESLAALEEAYDVIPDTWCVITGGNGRHIYMSLPIGVRVNNTAGKLGHGLDIRTTGGYVLAPPSRHISGSAYRWLFSPDEALLVEAPAWLLEALAPNPIAARPLRGRVTSRKNLRSIAGVLATVAEAPEGNRNNVTFWAACRTAEMVRAGWFSSETAADALLEAASQCGLPYHAALATIRSGLRTVVSAN